MKILKTILICLLIVLGSGTAAYFGADLIINGYLSKTAQSESIQSENIEVFNMKEYTQVEVDNIVILGIDSEDGTTRSDAIKLVSLDKTNYDITITSLQRDNLVWQPLQGRYEKLNHAYWYDRVEGTLSCINYNYDLDVKKYVSFSFDSIENIVDAIGGIDLYVTEQEANQGLHIEAPAGTYHVTGAQALSYCRLRWIDDDYGRMQRQNNVVTAIIQSVKNKSIPELLDVVNKCLPYIETNLTGSEIKEYAMSLLKYDLDHINQYQFPDEGFDDVIGSVEVNGFNPNYILRDFAGEVLQMHKNIYGEDGYTPSEKVLKISEETFNFAQGEFTH